MIFTQLSAALVEYFTHPKCIRESESKHKPLERQTSAIQFNSMQWNVMQFCIEAGMNFNYLQAELGDCCKSCLPQPLKCCCWTPLIRDVEKARGAKEEEQEAAWMLMSKGCRHAIISHNPNFNPNALAVAA